MTNFNRRGSRSKFEGTAKIGLGLFRSVTCTVEDVSNSGARLNINEDQKLPDTFWLKISGLRRKRRAATRWREGGQVGVEFTLD